MKLPKCEICKKEYVLKRKTQRTCLDKECQKELNRRLRRNEIGINVTPHMENRILRKKLQQIQTMLTEALGLTRL